MNTGGTAFQSSSATFGVGTSGGDLPFGFGGDPGEGFHSRGPVNVQDNDWTEKLHFQDKKKGDGAESLPFVPKYPTWHESPFVRYVPNVLSSGNLPPAPVEYKPEDRSTMGVPLNPFWIRNDRWSMKYEAEPFKQVGPDFVAPVVGVKGAQSKRSWKRKTYIDNLEQKAPEKEVIAGTVTSSAKQVTMGEMNPEKSNPAEVHKEPPAKRTRSKPTGSKKPKETVPQILS
jgi:hypothetical protein